MKPSSHIHNHPHMIATFLMNDISRICRQLVDHQMRQVGLTRAQWYLVNYVYMYDGLSQQELADLIDLGKSNVAQQIRSLEEKGWIHRGPHERDGRSFRVYMTDGMKPIVRKLNDLANQVLKETVGKLGEKELKQLIITLKGIDLNLEKELNQEGTTPNIRKLVEEIRKDLT